MQEIDFLPEWYKSGKRRQVSYRTQYVAISSVFIVMMVWSFVATRSISNAKAQIAQMAIKQAEAKKVSSEYAGLGDKIRTLRKNAKSLDDIDSKIDVASILGEISYLIDERIVLKKLEFMAEKFVNEKEITTSPSTVNIVRVVQNKMNNNKELPLGNVRFKIVIVGLAADTNDVAALMCKLEDSSYFCQVVLSYSRGNEEIGVRNAHSLKRDTNVVQGIEENKDLVRKSGENEKIKVNEFEINCYLANYSEL